jgi:uncharacterized membrane protein YccC
MMAWAALAGRILAAFGSLTCQGPRARLALASALSVGAALTLALWLHLAAPYWAGITGYVCMQASQPASVRRALHRIIGTVCGAITGLVLFSLVAYDHAATMLLLFLAGTIAILGSLLSRYSYAWLLGGITAIIIVLGALDDPAQAQDLAFYRSAEIILGSLSALAVSALLLPNIPGPAPRAPGWRSLGGHWHVLSHAVRTGICVAMVPVLWDVFALPGLSQMAISIGAIMAVPELTGEPARDNRAIAERAVQRIGGCLLGGIAGLMMVHVTSGWPYPFWLLAIMGAMGVAAELQSSPQGLTVAGPRAAVALILTTVQDWGPAMSLAPGVERIAGMLGALVLLFTVNLLFGKPVASTRLKTRAGEGQPVPPKDSVFL